MRALSGSGELRGGAQGAQVPQVVENLFPGAAAPQKAKTEAEGQLLCERRMETDSFQIQAYLVDGDVRRQESNTELANVQVADAGRWWTTAPLPTRRREAPACWT